LMADITNHFELLEEVGCLQELEIKKESLIVKGYAKSTKKLNLDEYLGLASNKLFYQRLVGERYKKFYVEGKFLPQFMNKKILINGKDSPMTLKKIFESILKKYSLIKQVCVFPGHGDAHQGNVIVSDKGDIVFIDNEYSGMMPAYMDLSKPYYNDLLGTLFFHFHERLLSYFEVESVKNDKTTLSLNIRLKQKLNARMKITQIKLKQRSKYLNDKEDFLTLNDYLFMCHTLNRDPNQFPEVVRWLFLAFCRVLYEFDSLDPESIYSYFED